MLSYIIFHFANPSKWKMPSSSSTRVKKEGKEVTHVQLISNDVHQPPFWAIPEITYKGDPSGALSMILTKVLMIQDVRFCYTCKLGEVVEWCFERRRKNRRGVNAWTRFSPSFQNRMSKDFIEPNTWQ